jgi:hypothetical protein
MERDPKTGLDLEYLSGPRMREIARGLDPLADRRRRDPLIDRRRSRRALVLVLVALVAGLGLAHGNRVTAPILNCPAQEAKQ